MRILILDTGSSSMRATLFDPEGNMLFSVSHTYVMHTEENGKSEMRPQIFSEALIIVCRQAAEKVFAAGLTIDAIALTSQRSSVVALDRENQPLGPIITWHDKRAATLCDQLNRQYGSIIRKKSGNRLTTVLSAPKIRLYRDLYPAAYNQAAVLTGIHEYLLALITGEVNSDVSIASRTCLMDIETCTWSEDLASLFGLDINRLCPLRQPGEIIGQVTDRFAAKTNLPSGLPVVTAGGDQQCSVVGQGIYLSGQAGITLGTGAYACMAVNQATICETPGINVTAAAIPNTWLLEASTLASGLTYAWFNQSFYPVGSTPDYDRINADVRNTPLGACGVVALPYIAGKTCPDWNPYATGVFYHLGSGSSRAHMARALLEAISADVSACYHAVSSGCKVQSAVTLCGGLSRLDTLNQMLADMTEREIAVPNLCETTAIGAWIVASSSLGLTADIADGVQRLQNRNEPKRYFPNLENTKQYKKIAEIRNLLEGSIPFETLQLLWQDLSGLKTT